MTNPTSNEREELKRALAEKMQDGWDCGDYDDILDAGVDFILADRAQLLQRILNEGPKDEIEIPQDDMGSNPEVITNQANAKWRALLARYKEKQA